MIILIAYACEHSFPATHRRELQALAGVKELWIIDPETRAITIHLFASDGLEKIRQVDEKDILSTDLLPGFDLAAEMIFER